MKTLLYLPRKLLIVLFAFLGPVIALLGIIWLANDAVDNVPAMIVFAIGCLSTYALVRIVRGNTLKPSEQFIKKTNDATKQWAVQKLDQIDVAYQNVEKRKSFVESVSRRSIFKPLEVVILGGSGWDSKKGSKYLLSIDDSKIYLSDLAQMTDSPVDIGKLTEVDISGPGKVTTNAGVIGGGFGAEGALKGVAVATVINLLTTHSSTKTIIRLGFHDAEIVMITSQVEPDAARIMLSPLFVNLKRKSPELQASSLSGELQRLFELKQSGAITEEEFGALKRQLIN